ncbi:ornithine cyclodeaminase family protein [Tahibacter amnicola]|uniref:Ornithine cyclodeaminase family protein n=1 Tax=Tahibacter amnicola TaxID=2976241 RepID=A0ABY6BKD2_9GAMM|nr:ornithine cyclodeaminase family protein [Tahibacter amnicola]UXI70474.1 ornithine cyclodeaminase family protein [Tahibacter amnicola]
MSTIQAGGTLLLTGHTLSRHLGAADYLAAVHDALVVMADASLQVPAVTHVLGEGGGVHVKTAASTRRAVIKINANFPGNPAHAGLPTIQGVVALVDNTDGRLLALMDSVEITAQRTAAVSAVAARQLARRDSTALGIIGCGLQARYHLAALRTLFPFLDLYLHDVDDTRVTAVANQAGNDLRVHACATPGAVARAADVLVTCTPSRRPLVHAADVKPGSFIAATGADSPDKQELAPDVLKMARVVTDSLAQAAQMGDLHHAISAGVVRESDIHAELADVVSGRTAGRSNATECFVLDSTGVAVSDLAAANLAYARCQADPAVPRIAFAQMARE